jgi:hypothetical protein
MTASHTTHNRGTKRRKTSVPDWSIQASARAGEKEELRNQSWKGRSRLRCIATNQTATRQQQEHDGAKRNGRRNPHIVLISNNSGCMSYATRYGPGNCRVPPPGQDAIETILQGFQEWHGNARRRDWRCR